MVLALAMTCLAGCGSKQMTAEEVMAKATEKQQTMTGIDASTKMDISMEIAGQSIEYDGTMNFKASSLNKEGMQMAIETTINMFGQEMNMNTYYTDGFYYMDAMGEKGKMAMDLAEITETVKQNPAFGEIPADAYKSLEMSEEGGNRVLTYVADGSKLTDMIDSLMGGMMGSLGETGDMDMDISLGEVSGTLTVDKDFNAVAQTMKMDMTMTIEGMEVSATADVDMTINNPGQDVTVELPDDLDSYEEMEQ